MEVSWGAYLSPLGYQLVALISSSLAKGVPAVIRSNSWHILHVQKTSSHSDTDECPGCVSQSTHFDLSGTAFGTNHIHTGLPILKILILAYVFGCLRQHRFLFLRKKKNGRRYCSS